MSEHWKEGEKNTGKIPDFEPEIVEQNR